MCYVILLVLAVRIILQQRVRNVLLQEEEPLEATSKKKSFSSTGNKILELFKPVKIVYIEEEGGAKRFLPKAIPRTGKGFENDRF